MATNVGIGYSVNKDSFKSGVECISKAIDKAGISEPDFSMIYCGRKHNPKEFLNGVRSVTKDSKLIGGSCFGVITNDNLGYDGYECGAAVIKSDHLKFDVFVQTELEKDEYAAGKSLGLKIKKEIASDYSLLLLYDSIKSNDPPRLNYATLFSKGLEETLQPFPEIVGGGLLSDALFAVPCCQFFNDRILEKSILAVSISGKHTFHSSIIHGCKPSSSYKTLTKVEGPVIYEIDNQPALEVIDKMLGPDHGLKWKDFALYITLGLNLGKKFEDFDYNNYANRLVLAVDEKEKALIMFEPDLKTGDEIQLMRRSIDLNYVTEGIGDIVTKVKNPLFIFYIDCAGRVKPFSGGLLEEAEEVQNAVGDIPLLGFYSGVELAKIRGKLQPLDWTGVVSVIGE
jgi:hypothetical protein